MLLHHSQTGKATESTSYFTQLALVRRYALLLRIVPVHLVALSPLLATPSVVA